VLQLRPNCECCDAELPPGSDAAFVCSFECTFCRACAEDRLGLACPNCGGELVRRPRRPVEKLARYPGSPRAASEAEALRAQVQRWIAASMAGEADTVLAMVTPDVVFLRPGHPPMHHDQFAAAQRAQSGLSLEAQAEVEEALVLGDWALTRTRLRVAFGGQARAGHTLTLWKKEDGVWRIARDANVLA